MRGGGAFPRGAAGGIRTGALGDIGGDGGGDGGEAGALGGGIGGEKKI